MATARRPDSARILRVGVIRGGRVVEEHLFRKRATVTIGRGPKNTIVVPLADVPQSFPVFDAAGRGYRLRFTGGMAGRLAVGDALLDLEAIIKSGLACRTRNGYAVWLTDESKGRVVVGEVTLLFQFVVPAPEVPPPELPAAVKGAAWRTLDRLFVCVLVATFGVSFGTVRAVTLRAPKPRPEPTLETLQKLQNRFVHGLLPKKSTPPQAEEAVAKTVRGREPGRHLDGPDKGEVGAGQKQAIERDLKTRGLLGLIGAMGEGGGLAIEDAFADGAAHRDIASALEGASGVDLSTSGGLSGPVVRKGSAAGEVVDIGSLATRGGAGAEGRLGDRAIARVAGRVIDEGPETDSAVCDRGAIASFVADRKQAIQACYEKELKRFPSLQGKLVVRFTILETGRVEDVEIEEETLGNENVVGCVRSTIRLWRFPIKGTECPVAYPFMFMPRT